MTEGTPRDWRKPCTTGVVCNRCGYLNTPDGNGVFYRNLTFSVPSISCGNCDEEIDFTFAGGSDGRPDAWQTLGDEGGGAAMKPTIYTELEQGTAEWHEVRCGVLTASEIGTLLTATGEISHNKKAKDLLFEKAAQRVTGLVDVTKQTFTMERGHDDEAEARDIYSAKIAPVSEVGFMTRTFGDVTLGYSPDGLVGDDGLIECKSRCQKFQMETMTRLEVPSEYMAQLQTGLLVSGRNWIDFISFPACGGGKMMVLRVLPDKEYAERILEAVQKAETAIGTIIAQYLDALQNKKARFFDTERRDYDAIDDVVELIDA